MLLAMGPLKSGEAGNFYPSTQRQRPKDLCQLQDSQELYRETLSQNTTYPPPKEKEKRPSAHSISWVPEKQLVVGWDPRICRPVKASTGPRTF